MTQPQSFLPEMHQATLDEGVVQRLFADIAACAEVIEVLAKFAPRQYVAQQPHTLHAARDLLLTGAARGVQIRYAYEGAIWWDTLLRVEGGFRLTRIRHEFEGG